VIAHQAARSDRTHRWGSSLLELGTARRHDGFQRPDMRGLAILPRYINWSSAREVGLFGIGAMRHEDLDDHRAAMAWCGPVIWR
jgi:hypothetical protein